MNMRTQLGTVINQYPISKVQFSKHKTTVLLLSGIAITIYDKIYGVSISLKAHHSMCKFEDVNSMINWLSQSL